MSTRAMRFLRNVQIERAKCGLGENICVQLAGVCKQLRDVQISEANNSVDGTAKWCAYIRSVQLSGVQLGGVHCIWRVFPSHFPSKPTNYSLASKTA